MDIFDSCVNDEPIQSLKPQFTKNSESYTDDFFESSVSLERSHVEEGYADGYKQGMEVGKHDGYEVGLKHGFQVGEELGFYRSLIGVWLAAMWVKPNCFLVRIRKTIQQMKELIDQYPLMDPDDETKDDALEGLKLKFRAVCATLGVKLEYIGYPRKSNSQEVDF